MAKKLRADPVPRAVFSHLMSKMDFSPIVLVEKKYACHGYINNHQSPFIGPIKIDQKCENYPPLTIVVLK